LKSTKGAKGAKCIVPGCEEQYGVKKSVALHTFPVDQTRRKEWMKALGISIAPDLLTDKFRVCGFHFNSNDYKATKTRPLLKNDAIPSRVKQRPIQRKLEFVQVNLETSNVEIVSDSQSGDAQDCVIQQVVSINFLRDDTRDSVVVTDADLTTCSSPSAGIISDLIGFTGRVFCS
jgi:hypothetical protein